jgi:hypothetical protein
MAGMSADSQDADRREGGVADACVPFDLPTQRCRSRAGAKIGTRKQNDAAAAGTRLGETTAAAGQHLVLGRRFPRHSMAPLLPFLHASRTLLDRSLAVRGGTSGSAPQFDDVLKTVALSVLSNSMATALVVLATTGVSPRISRLARAFIIALLCYTITWLFTGHVPMGYVPGSVPILPMQPSLA